MRSDFLAYNRFPEVYHARGISKAPFFGGARAVAGQGVDTTYSVMSSLLYLYILCHGGVARRCGVRRSGTTNFRIRMQKANPGPPAHGVLARRYGSMSQYDNKKAWFHIANNVRCDILNII